MANALLWVAVALGGFVFFEPAPYDLLLALVIPAWMLLGLQIPRAISPLVVLLITFMVGGVLAATQARNFATQPMYMAVSAFLCLSAWFVASLIAHDRRKLDIIVSAWIFSAAYSSMLGIAGYFGLTGELFVKFGRATGGFQDPNVFGPFLIFPFLVLVRRVLVGRPAAMLVNGALALLVFSGIFLCFSRATWGLAVLGLLLMGLLMFVTERSPTMRARYLVLGAAGVVALALLLAVALSIPAVSDLFNQRAQVVQDYDGGHMGRFERHAAGFRMMLERPLGIGAIEFGRLLGEDEHDIWLKTLTTYGWLGFVSFLTLTLWTIAAAFPLLFRAGPFQAVMQIAFITFVGHIIMATVIDIDHWRHFFMLFGILWGGVAADRIAVQQRLAAGLVPIRTAAVPPLAAPVRAPLRGRSRVPIHTPVGA